MGFPLGSGWGLGLGLGLGLDSTAPNVSGFFVSPLGWGLVSVSGLVSGLNVGAWAGPGSGSGLGLGLGLGLDYLCRNVHAAPARRERAAYLRRRPGKSGAAGYVGSQAGLRVQAAGRTAEQQLL